MGQVQNAHAKEAPFLCCDIDDPGTQIGGVVWTARSIRVDHIAGLPGHSRGWCVNIEDGGRQSSHRVSVTDRVRGRQKEATEYSG